MTRRIVVLAKAPIRGLVKTRLAAAIGPDEALDVHRRLTSHVLAEIEAAIDLLANDGELDAEVRVTPDGETGSARTWVPSPIRVRDQGEGDLGDRIRRAFDDGFAEGATCVVVVGTDCPGLTSRHVREAFEALAGSDVVIGPATDGGYWLLGATAPTPDVFDGVPWSTSIVLETTLRLARETGRTVARLETLTDVDTIDDLDHVRGQGPRP